MDSGGASYTGKPRPAVIVQEDRFDQIDDMIHTTSQVFLGLTLSCARCHNHKLDAVSMNDYYAMLGIIRSSRQVSHTIDDAEVTVQFFMPAMPTMNMPAMKSEAKLAPAGGGVYRGSGQVMMAGRWDATVTVVRGGQRLGTKQLPVVAR